MNAREWLFNNGYEQFRDDTWSLNGEPADVELALQTYMDQQAEKKRDIS